ncbi:MULTISPECIES: hypothetical protein [Actinobacillus]|uniref:Uncharacterized protein n=5 Tax=Actinobacillus pleuropneumoniae TaxID=715 RepID=A0A223MDB8_ACTPL|nr:MULTISPECIES: hypothetical protein [Actinobacillus]ABY70308.1 hypothetical protein APJL_1758 [Actinobacillus pleuropneumoniae serovar 3 str. JL03]ACE62436.1 hypothetical protein APP7_1784 [Actinobacillus pleuropneumoniae serovar 7 str. AP76]ASU15572.1 hypothetical protein CHY23_00800 [Actinobacillus pleuropneumoniae]AWG96139.1 hypothetical protein APPSER1_09425 [Actinobacillus pleuropneumoniae serovar 1 str. 4074]AXA22209.1 hypothetical protein DRF63_09420 [Actinobacillus pleuropneumoniae]
MEENETFYITFDERLLDYLKNSDAQTHFVSFVEVENEVDIPTALSMKIKKSDRHQISSKPFKIKSYSEEVNT